MMLRFVKRNVNTPKFIEKQYCKSYLFMTLILKTLINRFVVHLFDFYCSNRIIVLQLLKYTNTL